MPYLENRINKSTGDSAMKTVYGVILVSMLLLVTGCAQKVNDPADVEAIRNLDAVYDEANNAGDPVALADYFTDDAVRLGPNREAIVGQEAVRSDIQADFDQFKHDGLNVSEDIRVSGDLAVVRGTFEDKSSLKAGGYSIAEKGKWVGAFQRQADGSWKCFWDIWNSDLPVGDTLPIGEEEQSLLQLEREWMEALENSDVDALGKILATDYVRNFDGQVTTRAQLLANLRRGAFKTESATASDMKALVLGSRAIVQGVTTFKGSERGTDTSGKYLWTDVYEKRDGRWQCVTGYVSKVD